MHFQIFQVHLQKHSIPLPDFEKVDSEQQLHSIGEKFGPWSITWVRPLRFYDANIHITWIHMTCHQLSSNHNVLMFRYVSMTFKFISGNMFASVGEIFFVLLHAMLKREFLAKFHVDDNLLSFDNI